eukprot:5542485-Amphidinium_carterae.1
MKLSSKPGTTLTEALGICAHSFLSFCVYISALQPICLKWVKRPANRWNPIADRLAEEVSATTHFLG